MVLIVCIGYSNNYIYFTDFCLEILNILTFLRCVHYLFKIQQLRVHTCKFEDYCHYVATMTTNPQPPYYRAYCRTFRGKDLIQANRDSVFLFLYKVIMYRYTAIYLKHLVSSYLFTYALKW